jgi:predicted CDP-diglyceride synthetase/phosphatidate cytidylyltransferase
LKHPELPSGKKLRKIVPEISPEKTLKNFQKVLAFFLKGG